MLPKPYVSGGFDIDDINIMKLSKIEQSLLSKPIREYLN